MFDKSTRRRRLGLVSIATLGAVASLTLLPFASALADVTTGFELDGNVLDNTATAPPDWGAASGTNSIFTVDASGTGVPRTPLPANFLSAGFTRDFIPGSTADNTTYTNGSKDINNISTGWACVSSSNVTDKGDIQNGYAAAYNDPATGDLMLYFGMEKNAPNGDNNMGVWFLQDPTVSCANPNGGSGLAFTGNHTDGDILLVAAFTSGGSVPTVSAYRWNGGAGGSLSTTALATGGKCGLTTSTNLCAITNDTASVTTPWQTTNKASQSPSNKTGQGTTLGADQFYEGAVDLTANHLDTNAAGNAICVNKFVFDTRSSQTLNATLYDYAEGNVQTCAAPKIATNLFLKQAVPPDTSLAPPNNTVTLPATVYDTASITGALGTPSGTVTYSLWTNNACTTAATAPTFTGGGNSATVMIATDGTIPPSPTLVFDTPGSFWWKAVYSGGGRNSGNTSVCTDEPLVVNPVQPALATVPSLTSVVIGGNPAASFTDRANITGGYFPSGGIAVGDVSFKLYGPFATSAAVSCAGTPAFTSTNAATRDTDSTAHAISGAYTPTTVGVYQWTAAYAGNAQNKPVSATACNDTTEQVTVTPATPTLASKILLSDTAKVSGIPNAGAPAGSVVFTLFPSNDCSGTALYTSPAVAISASGTASTSTATPVAAGSYSWQVVFTPDTTVNPNYVGASTSCSPADEQATISYNGTSPSP